MAHHVNGIKCNCYCTSIRNGIGEKQHSCFIGRQGEA
jgi:hypothetical protein